MADVKENERVTRETLPTVSFTLTNSLIREVTEEAKRLNVKKSKLVRDLLTTALVISRQQPDASDEVAA